MAANPANTSHQPPGGAIRLVLGIVGLCGIAALMAALVWVLQGQVQQAEVLRSQWQGNRVGTRDNRAVVSEAGPTALNIDVGHPDCQPKRDGHHYAVEPSLTAGIAVADQLSGAGQGACPASPD